jgi:hypothetical protein
MAEINLANLKFKKVIMHQIFGKEDKQPHATVDPSKNLFKMTDEATEILHTRLTDAAGRNSKAFDLEVGNSSKDSFYDIAINLKNKSDKIFIDKSTAIAHLLAEKQTSSNMPGGYLLIIEAEDNDDKRFVLIVIKAELHEAFRSEKKKGESILQVLNDIFLSPSQKLYKLGVIYEKENPKGASPNNLYGCFLFDDQFRRNVKPAEYFYSNFLGFDISNNAKIQSQNFYNETFNFIKSNIQDTKEKFSLINELKNVFTINTDTTITPSDFSKNYIRKAELRDKYATEVLPNFRASIIKDSTLIDYKLAHKKWDFPNKINLSGPEENFDESVKLISDSKGLQNLDPSDKTYSIIKIKGRPLSDD